MAGSAYRRVYRATTPNLHNGRDPTRSELLRAALEYAARGWPVFPVHSIDERGVCTCGGPEINPKCSPGKHPRTPNGLKDATRDQSRITAMFNSRPGSNVGIGTGDGLMVLDVDPERWGAGSLDALEAEHGPLSETYAVETGGGGLHFYFSLPAGVEVSNSAGKLGPGLDVRGDGGYVVAPPSATTRPYKVLEDRPLAEAPDWLLQRLREPQRAAREAAKPRPSFATPPVVGRGCEPIPEGTRNATLTRIAGRLHDGRDLDQLAAELLEINATRCSPPLEDAEVEKIAASIHGREPCKPGTTATREVLEALEPVEAGMWRRDRDGDWRGMGGKSERDAYAALIVKARERGTMVSGGVRVSISVREWALLAAVSKRAMLDYRRGEERKPGIISRLKRRGLIRTDHLDRRDGESGAFVLAVPAELPRAGFHHSPTGLVSEGGGETLRAPPPPVERAGDQAAREVAGGWH